MNEWKTSIDSLPVFILVTDVYDTQHILNTAHIIEIVPYAGHPEWSYVIRTDPKGAFAVKHPFSQFIKALGFEVKNNE